MNNNIDIIGKKFGKLKVLEASNKRSSNGNILYKCKCDCGNITYVAARFLKNGHTKSCGCTRKEKLLEHSLSIKNDLIGRKFGRLTALKYIRTDNNGNTIWLCKCTCGNTKEILAESLLNGNTVSCGCISKEQIKEESKKNLIDNTNIAIVKSLLKNSKSNITKSKIKGIGWDKRHNKWRAYIMFKGKQYHLGYFTELEDATMARKEAEQKLFGEFLKWYNNR